MAPLHLSNYYPNGDLEPRGRSSLFGLSRYSPQRYAARVDSENPTDRSKFKECLYVFHDLKRAWFQILLFAVAMRAAVAVVLLPLLALLLQLALGLKGQDVLSDQEILYFVLSPLGILSLVLLGGFWTGVAFVEQAGMMTIGYGAISGTKVSWVNAFRYVFHKLPRILLLGCHLVGRTLLISAPFLVASGITFLLLLREYDINYYLQNHPPKFIVAAIIIGLLLAILAVILIRKITGWMIAIPCVLFSDLGASAAIRKSIADSHGHRLKFAGWIVAWLAGGAVLSAITTWLIGFFGRLLVALVSGSMTFTAIAIGGIGLTTLITNFLLSLFAAAFFALVLVRIYKVFSGPGNLDSRWISNEDAKVFISRKAVIVAGAAVLILLVISAPALIRARIVEDKLPLIIAHRGASSIAPENTMASIREAIAAQADFVEIDVQETADDVVVVMHDSDFMKVASNPLKTWDATLAALESIDIGSYFGSAFADERVPTLDQVLSECKGRIKVVIELKYYGHDRELEQRVIDLVEAHDLANEVSIMSLKADKIEKTKALRPDWDYGVLTSVQLGNVSSFDANFLAVNASAASRSFVRNAQKSGHDLYVWTVNDPLLMSAMMERNVDGIITDKPALAKRVRETWAEMNVIERFLISVGTKVGVLSISDVVSDENDV